MYRTPYCSYCLRAKSFLEGKGVSLREIDVSRDPALRRAMIAKSGRSTVPQVFIDGHPVGGYTDLLALDHRGELDRLLRGTLEERS